MRIVVASDRPVVRAGLAGIAEEAGAEVVAQVEEGELVATCIDLEADAALLQLARGDDLDAVADLAAEILPVALLCLAEEGVAVASLVAAGVSVLSLEATSALVHNALDAAAAGLVVVDPRLNAAAAEAKSASDRPDDYPVESLTPRELQVLRLLAQGLTNPAVARELGISQHTAKFHVTAVLGKLGASTRAEAVAKGIRMGFILV